MSVAVAEQVDIQPTAPAPNQGYFFSPEDAARWRAIVRNARPSGMVALTNTAMTPIWDNLSRKDRPVPEEGATQKRRVPGASLLPGDLAFLGPQGPELRPLTEGQETYLMAALGRLRSL